MITTIIIIMIIISLNNNSGVVTVAHVQHKEARMHSELMVLRGGPITAAKPQCSSSSSVSVYK